MAVININRNQFEEMVHSGKTVLVEFSAPWCVYCRRLAPALESVAEEYKDKNPLLICPLKGSVMFFADIIREMDIPCEIDFMVV